MLVGISQSLIHLVTMVLDIPSTLGMKHKTESPVPHCPWLALCILPFIHHHCWGSRVPFIRGPSTRRGPFSWPRVLFPAYPLCHPSYPLFCCHTGPGVDFCDLNLFLWKLLSLPISPSFPPPHQLFLPAPHHLLSFLFKGIVYHFLLTWSNVTWWGGWSRILGVEICT